MNAEMNSPETREDSRVVRYAKRTGAIGKAFLVYLASGSVGLAIIAYLVFAGAGC